MLPLFQGLVMGPAAYTTQLQAGLGLVAETQQLLALWTPELSAQGLYRAALASGRFSNVTARRLRNLVVEGFSPRYLVENGKPARLLRSALGRVSNTDFRALCFVFTCRANSILGDFVRQVYWPAYSAGKSAITKRDALDFVGAAVSNGLTHSPWAASTISRVSGYLLGSCADFGLLGANKAGARSVETFGISPTVASFLAHDLHFRGLGDNALLRRTEWEWFGLDSKDALDELKRLSLRGEIVVQSAGRSTRVSWKYKSIEGLADGILKG
jgi:hypothetical protein